jgi:threonine/homoserine/homoserine lactone efflux protein
MYQEEAGRAPALTGATAQRKPGEPTKVHQARRSLTHSARVLKFAARFGLVLTCICAPFAMVALLQHSHVALSILAWLGVFYVVQLVIRWGMRSGRC